jgi:hypothetical protein
MGGDLGHRDLHRTETVDDRRLAVGGLAAE